LAGFPWDWPCVWPSRTRQNKRKFHLNLSRNKTNHEITNLLKAYEKALNTSDAKAALALYGSDPIVMPQNMPAFIGREAVQTTYEGFFKVLKLNVVFTIHEIVDMGGDMAYGRTTSAGEQEILAGHKISKEANNELRPGTPELT
jgi:ketosteroid isomerase-like protein